MKIIFEKELKHEGNDCLIYDSAVVVELSGDSYLASANTVYRGRMGFDTRSESFIFNDAKLAVDYAEKRFAEKTKFVTPVE